MSDKPFNYDEANETLLQLLSSNGYKPARVEQTGDQSTFYQSQGWGVDLYKTGELIVLTCIKGYDEVHELTFEDRGQVIQLLRVTDKSVFGSLEKWCESLTHPNEFSGKRVAFVPYVGIIATADTLDELSDKVSKLPDIYEVVHYNLVPAAGVAPITPFSVAADCLKEEAEQRKRFRDDFNLIALIMFICLTARTVYEIYNLNECEVTGSYLTVMFILTVFNYCVSVVLGWLGAVLCLFIKSIV